MVERIRVLQIITRLIVGGAQETVMLLADGLDSTRFEVEVVSGPQTGAEGSLIPEVRALGIPLTIVPCLVRQVSLFKNLRALFALYKIIRRGKYDIVHTHSSMAGFLGRLAAWLAGAPVIVHTVHGWAFHDWMSKTTRWFYIIMEKLVAPLSDRLIVVSPRNAQKGLAAGIAAPEKYLTIRSGIDIERFAHPPLPASQVRQSFGITEAAPLVVTVTRLSPQKAPLDFLRAAALVVGIVPDARSLIVGDGPMRAQVEVAIHEMGLSGRVVLAGLRRDVPSLIGAANVFVLSSLWEGLPRVILQAMAAGKPVVATAADGSAEAVQNGVNGLLVTPGDPAELARAITSLLLDPDRAVEMGQRGRKIVQAFGVEKMIADVEALYLDLLEGKGE